MSASTYLLVPTHLRAREAIDFGVLLPAPLEVSAVFDFAPFATTASPNTKFSSPSSSSAGVIAESRVRFRLKEMVANESV